MLHRNLLRQIHVGGVEEGTPPHQVIARLTVTPGGEITDIRLERASAYPQVNQAVLRVIRNAQKQPPFTPDMPDRPLEFRLPVNIKP
ncbi:TonB family protein [Paracoccus sp. YIM 132242]|uniref:TonB family protein n=1 Tax=Paracoccus lichenicola TaxID=2665644 RepID=A0A6L6HU92_9RHOB|nr:energy transducer TonB [Paracoccus lichenicola]MTE00868.1 TonB family protein [Paracoccus lichenicola]